MPRAFPQHIQRRIDCHAMDPRRQLRVPAERAQRAQGAHEDLLHRVARVLSISGHTQRDPVDALLVSTDDSVEGCGLTARQPLDELAILPLVHRLYPSPIVTRSIAGSTSSLRAGMRATEPS